MTVFNFTNRRKIPTDGVYLSVGVSDINGNKFFSYKCKLVGDWHIEHSDILNDSKVSFRFKDRISGRPSLERFSFEQFKQDTVSGYLKNIKLGEELPQCDINIIDANGMILFKGQDWKIYDEKTNALAKPSSILPVRSVDLDALIYKVDYSSEALGPILLVNKALHIKSKLIQPHYSALILVPVIEQVLTYAIFVVHQDLKNPSGWFEDWLKVFPFDSTDYDPSEGLENNTQSILDWIERVVNKYADSYGFVNKLLLEEENG